jgi:hypothetical protein
MSLGSTRMYLTASSVQKAGLANTMQYKDGLACPCLKGSTMSASRHPPSEGWLSKYNVVQVALACPCIEGSTSLA